MPTTCSSSDGSSSRWNYAEEADLIALDMTVAPDVPKQAQEKNSDSENEETDAAQTNAAEKGRMQNVVFSAWLSQKAEKTTAEELARTKPQKQDEQMSIHDLMAKHEARAIISDPRDYQMELFEKAKKQNIIAVLDTGSGKTLIAVLLIKHVLEQELEDRAAGKPARVAFFVVEKVALCYQQFAVLEANLDQPIEMLCGDTNIDSFNRLEWERLLTENKVIVCTADVLSNVLHKGFVLMQKINLLIFDEAHHTKKNHAYAKIIKEFYVPQSPDERPRIFGMSASPVDAKEDVEESALRLETLLHSQIATTTDLSLMQYCISRPQEIRLSYRWLERPYRTTLATEMHRRYGNLRVLGKQFERAATAASELGEWCADRLWVLSFSEEEVSKLESKTEQDHYTHKRYQDVEVLNKQISLLREAQRFIQESVFPAPTFKDNNISPKLQELNRFLFDLYLHAPQSRTLIFVKRRYTAKLLGDILKLIGSPHIMLDILTGTGNAEPGEPNVSIRQQMFTIRKFSKGSLNLLIATSVAEEGLDIPDCNCVIRFDLYTTMIQYIQSRGRARHKDSKFVSMIESGNQDHEQIISDVRQGEWKMRRFCNSLPQDRILQGNDHDLASLLETEKGLLVYKEPGTGAKLTFHSALMTLEHFVTSLPRDEESLLKATYAMTYDRGGFTCEVVLPPQAPIRTAQGRQYTTKALAKRSAAFEMCLLLRKGQYLNQDLLPIYHKQLPAMRNAQLALNAKSTNSYPMRLKPDLWMQDRGIAPVELYVTLIGLEEMTALSRKVSPLALLTRSPLPQIPAFPVFVNPEGKTNAISIPVLEPLIVMETALIQLTTFTLQVYYDLFNKRYENNPANMSYWIAPLSDRAVDTIKSQQNVRMDVAQALIDWDALEYVRKNDAIAWAEEMTAVDLEDKFLVDKWDGGRRFFTEEVIPYMRPNDPVPANCAPAKYNSSILEYSISLFSKSRYNALHTWNDEQPVIRAHRIVHRRNWLDEWTQADRDARTLAYICPEPLRISAIPAAIAAMCYVFPAILHRIEQYLIVKEGAAALDLPLRLDLALEAMTKDSDNTEEHRLEQVHFQRGMGKNYERLEFIGDTFLKMATSIALYAQNAGDDEFESHVKRMLMVCNKNLFNHAVKGGLFEYIRTTAFSRRTWYPEGLKLLEGKGKNLNHKTVVKHRLNDKSIADVCEALIGAALLSPSDPSNMDVAVKAVTVMVQSADHTAQAFEDYAALYRAPAWQSAPATASQLDLVEQLTALDGYRFRSARLLRCAFTHPSYPFSRERVPSYQRLEFLGDALLDMACVRWLYDQHPNRDPQWLTEHKMAMVSNQFLGALSVYLGFHRHLKHSHPALLGPVTEYAAMVADAAAAAPEGQMDYWLQLRSPPKCLPDIVEAYVGALFIDAGFDYKRVESFVDTHIVPFFRDMALYDDFAHAHPAATLQRLLATPPLRCGRARVLAAPLPTIVEGRVETGTTFAAAAMVHEAIVASAEAPSARQAKAKASERAVRVLQVLQREDFVRRFGCDCRDEDVQKVHDAGDPDEGAKRRSLQPPEEATIDRDPATTPNGTTREGAL